MLFTALIIKLFFNNLSYQLSHYFLKFVYKKIKLYFKKNLSSVISYLQDKIPELYFYDFNWVMNDVGIYNLKNIEKDIIERIQKAKIYFQEIDDAVALKTNCFNGENCLLEYPIILKKTHAYTFIKN